VRYDDFRDRCGVHQPLAVGPQAQVGEVAARCLEDHRAPRLHLQPVRELLEVLERAVDRLQLDERGRLRGVAFGEAVDREPGRSTASFVRVRDNLVRAAVEEDIEAPIGLSRHAVDFARTGEAVEQLQRRALRAGDRDGVATELGDGENGFLSARGRHGGATESRD
jgi:hypothetical protein